MQQDLELSCKRHTLIKLSSIIFNKEIKKLFVICSEECVFCLILMAHQT